ncbi:bifunctional diguanylate cyclase/phosphodiesterase [Paraburkholderia sp. UYCP14C]|uniref:putative bifunctional diguanylate cyclase/phosphodiesterase n=1 Tax=Paraburkholderia sp. UYCP14C TaxID=2511130 RepID=UPI001459FF29|nr:EAL domain-containing protein [Paraburkholderia sp. UYCP14C]
MIRIARSLLTKPALFIFAGICITLATTGITAVSLYQMRQDAMTQARDAAKNLALSLQKETEHNLDICQLAMQDVVTSMKTPGTLQLAPDARHLVAFSAAKNVRELGAIFAADASGNSLLDSRWILPPKLNVSERDYFQVQQQQKGAGLYLSKPFVSSLGSAGQPSIALSLRLEDANGRFAGIVAGTLRLSYFHQLFKDSILGAHGTLTLLRTDGTVLMRQPYHPDDIGRSLAGGHSFATLVQSDHGTYVDVAVIDHVERMYSFRRLGNYPLVMVVGLATEDIYAEWRKRAFAIGIVTAILDALTIMLCLMFSGQLRRRYTMERQLRKLAWFDALTGLPNRAQLNREMLRILTDAARSASQSAVLFIDLDRFKRVNDTQGHGAGDEVLCEIARRLRDCVRGEDVVGRLGGDEFLAVLQNCDVHRAAQVAGRVLQALYQPISVNTKFETSITLSASVGVALYPHDGQDADTLLRNADMAMYKAKSTGRNQVHFYAPVYERQAKEQLELEIALQRALRAGGLSVAYQPKVNVTGALRGVEALVRWHDGKLGTVPPDRVISIAEESGLITELDGWVLDEACRQLAEWRAAGIDVPSISANVCAADFKRADFAGLISHTLRVHGLQPADLILEMTEGVMFDESADDIRASLDAIHALGIALSIDDFGTGYSSLSYLQRFPVKELKIDKSFVRGIGTDAMSESLAHALINIGNVLNLSVIAEGVETQAQRDFLENHGCLMYQGYLYSPPLPPRDFVRWVDTQRQRMPIDLSGAGCRLPIGFRPTTLDVAGSKRD